MTFHDITPLAAPSIIQQAHIGLSGDDLSFALKMGKGIGISGQHRETGITLGTHSIIRDASIRRLQAADFEHEHENPA
jgi:hypothetical protein